MAIEYLKSAAFCLPPPPIQMASLTSLFSSGPQEAALPETESLKLFLQSSLTKRSTEIMGGKNQRLKQFLVLLPTLHGTASIAGAMKASTVGLCSTCPFSLGSRRTCLPRPSCPEVIVAAFSCELLGPLFLLFANLTLLTLLQIFPLVISLFKTLRQEAHKSANEQS